MGFKGAAWSLLVALSDRLRRLLEEGQVDDPRFRDRSRFPCGVVGCEERSTCAEGTSPP